MEPQASDDTEVAELRCVLDPAGPPAVFDDLPQESCPFLGGAPVSADGVHTFYAAAMDIWGNKSAPISAGFKIDMPPPGLTSLEMTVNREQAYTGSILEYKLTVRNLTGLAQNFTVSDPIPASTEIVRRINYDPATNASSGAASSSRGASRRSPSTCASCRGRRAGRRSSTRRRSRMMQAAAAPWP